MYNLVIKNGTVVTAGSVTRADVAIDGEIIAAIGEDLTGRRVIDATDQYVLPGGVDVHVHLDMPIGRYTTSDNFYEGTRAAAFGGTTAIVDFVETEPDETMLQALAARQAVADPQVTIDYGLHMTIRPHDIGRLEQVTPAREAGCSSFKLYMAYGNRLLDNEILLALEAVRDARALPVIHAENWDIICALVEKNLAAGRTTPHWHPRSRPTSFEAEATGRAIDIAAYVGTPLYVFHVSSADTAGRIAAAQQQGLAVTAETCPQYLFLTQDLYDRPGIAGALPVCSPPLRTEADQVALWEALIGGTLNVVSTDHAPFTAAEKAYGLAQKDYSQIPGGVPSIESRVALVYQGLVTNRPPGIPRDMALMRWIDVCSTTPAELFGFKTKGRIKVGWDADLVVFDPQKAVAIKPDSLHETTGWTPYEDMSVTGWPTVTLSRGKVICHNGRWLGRPGHGCFVAR